MTGEERGRRPSKSLRQKAGRLRSSRLAKTKEFVGGDSEILRWPVVGGLNGSLTFWGWKSQASTPALTKAVSEAHAASRFMRRMARKRDLLPGREDQPLALDLVQLIIADGARLAWGLAHMDMSRRPAARAEQEQLNDAIRSIDLMKLARINVDSVTFAESREYAEAVSDIVDRAEALRASISMLPPSSPQAITGGSDDLMRYYVREVSKNWISLFGEPPRGSSGPYVRILSAGWEDLGWPLPGRGTSLESLIGNAVAKSKIFERSAS